MCTPILLPAAPTEIPALKLPQPPETQPGDEQEVTTTVGAMRNALYYYELAPLLTDYATELYVYAHTQAATADEFRMQYITAEEARKQWRSRALWTTAAAAVLATVLTIDALRD